MERRSNLVGRKSLGRSYWCVPGLVLTEAQVIALERSRLKRKLMASSKASIRLLRPQHTFYVVNWKGVGRINQQTFIDTYTRVAFAKLHDRKTSITAADLLNDRSAIV
jgi:hypothetical protein